VSPEFVMVQEIVPLVDEPHADTNDCARATPVSTSRNAAMKAICLNATNP
jgi:hypothetical protein